MARNLSNAAASLLPYSTIEAAASGNVDAINAVLKHYILKAFRRLGAKKAGTTILVKSSMFA